MKGLTMILPNPDFTWDPTTGECTAGVRPYRKGSFRLEAKPLGSKYVVHNYGHGGAGITLCWGCADEVKKLVVAHVPDAGSTSVAVLGAGVMGLCAAFLLHLAGYRVTIYASALADTTSEQTLNRISVMRNTTCPVI